MNFTWPWTRAAAERKAARSVYDRWIELIDSGRKSKAGPAVTLESAFRVSAAFACMRVIANGVAQVPFKVFRQTEANGLATILPARDHPLYDRIAVKPNAWNTSFEFRETLALHACMGNAYAFKNVFRGELLELILIDPCRVKPVQAEDWSINYEITGRNGERKTFPQEMIWHVRGPSWDGFLGLDTLKFAREALGLSLAAEETHASLHANGVRPTGIYSVEGTLNTDQYQSLARWIKEKAGADTAGTPLILDRNAKWLNQAMTGLDAQHLEMRAYQVEEVCRFFGILPIMIGHADKASTYASAEQMFLAHKVHGLDPWYCRIEQSADANLLSDQDRRDGYYTKFVAAGLLRGSTKDRSEYFAKALGSGGSPAWMTQDEVRALEELNPLGGTAAILPVVTNAPRAPSPTP